MALIKCEDVSIGYEGQTVVRDLNFQIDSGDYLCIVGENGSAAGSDSRRSDICPSRPTYRRIFRQACMKWSSPAD